MYMMQAEELTISWIDGLRDKAEVSHHAFQAGLKVTVSLQNFMAMDTITLAAGGLP